MTPLAVAIERRDWQSVALFLLLGVTDAASRLPPGSLATLLDLLGGEAETEHGRGSKPDA